MKKISKITSLILATAVSTLSLVSCGSKKPTIDGTWKFEDGSKITFNLKKGTYISKGETNTISGDFLLMNGGILSTTGTNGQTERYVIALTDNGFDIDFNGSSISLSGKKVDSVQKLNGIYKSTNSVLPMKFQFKKSASTLSVTLSGNGEDQTQSFTYRTEPCYKILFTSGDYAFGESLDLEFPDPKHMNIDGELLSR